VTGARGGATVAGGVHVAYGPEIRGFEAATIVPAGHIVLVGEPGAGRSDLIEALGRATRRRAEGGTMIEKVVETWHRFLAGERPEALDGLLADDVVHGAFRYTKQVLAGDVAMLEFERQIRPRRRHHPLR
jgi:hypothetical protein